MVINLFKAKDPLFSKRNKELGLILTVRGRGGVPCSTLDYDRKIVEPLFRGEGGVYIG